MDDKWNMSNFKSDIIILYTVCVFKIDAAIRKPFRRWAGIPRQTQTRKT